jgi:hypothetical protein
MFNNYQFNDAEFNEISLTSIFSEQDDIAYNWFWFHNANIIVNSINDSNWNSIDSQIYNNPLTDWWWELNYLFREKIINITGHIKQDTTENLIKYIDIIKGVLWKNNQNLDIKVNWTIRRAKASCMNLDTIFDKKHYHLTLVPFSISFRIIEGFQKELTSQSQTLTGQTAGFTEEIINTWTIRTNPIFNILFNSATSVTEIILTLWTDILTINDTIATNNLFIIDCENKIITKNWVEVDFLWTFPKLEVWTNSYTIAINGTKNFDISVIYFNNYL